MANSITEGCCYYPQQQGVVFRRQNKEPLVLFPGISPLMSLPPNIVCHVLTCVMLVVNCIQGIDIITIILNIYHTEISAQGS